MEGRDCCHMVVQAVNQNAGRREEGERSGRQGDATPTPSNPHICLKTAAMTPPSGTCVEPGSFITACFFFSCWEDLNELSS